MHPLDRIISSNYSIQGRRFCGPGIFANSLLGGVPTTQLLRDSIWQEASLFAGKTVSEADEDEQKNVKLVSDLAAYRIPTSKVWTELSRVLGVDLSFVADRDLDLGFPTNNSEEMWLCNQEVKRRIGVLLSVCPVDSETAERIEGLLARAEQAIRSHQRPETRSGGK